MTSDHYVALMEEKSVKKEAAEKSKVEKKYRWELDRKQREEAKLQEQEIKYAKDGEHACKMVFD